MSASLRQYNDSDTDIDCDSNHNDSYTINNNDDDDDENSIYNKGKNNVGMQSQEDINSRQSSMGFVF